MPWRMDRAHLPLNALRAFEAAARHLNFTRAGLELCVSQGAVSHQVALLEERLGVPLFRRLPRGLALTDEGHALVPVVADAFDRIGVTLDRYADGRLREVLTLGVVGTFAAGWLLRRLERFAADDFERGAIEGVQAVSDILAREFPSDGSARDNELSDEPIIL